MTYKSFLLDGSWEMGYSADAYTSETIPEFESELIENSVPGYWEDMKDRFCQSNFYSELKVNPSFGNQRYPISSTAPDMALPNYMGNFFYKRKFDWTGDTQNACIHFAGVQNTVRVWLNGKYLGCHKGYSTPFDIEVTKGTLKEGINEVVLSVSNLPMAGYGGNLISGLTNRAANEYTGGICGSVELRIKTSPLTGGYCLVSKDCKSVDVKLTMDYEEAVSWELFDGTKIIDSGKSYGDFSLSAKNLELWTPENPKLYTVRVYCKGATLDLVLGVRRLVADGQKFRLNGKPCFLRGVCEHCYFPETVHPNHDGNYYRSIVKSLKELGFNFIRFHTYIPEEEYMKAADELGMLVHVESPNNTTLEEWAEIVNFCRNHPSVVIYCCGNELLIDEPFIAHLKKCADCVHNGTDALFSPMSALRGVEYYWEESNMTKAAIKEPFYHCPDRLELLSEFSDMYSSYANELLSYESLKADPEVIDNWGMVYKKPRVSHEICIDGTYTDLSLEDRYKNLPAGQTEMFSSIRKHLENKGMLKNAPLYFKNSSMWQSKVRKYCFEAARRCNNMAGFDFLGPIDTHWHTFGYDVGMMNEFYELKPGESIRNVLMYNSSTVLLNDLGLKTNYESGQRLKGNILASYFGRCDLDSAELTVRLFESDKPIYKETVKINNIKNGEVSSVYKIDLELPCVDTPKELKLACSLAGEGVNAENEWELYVFPAGKKQNTQNLVISNGMSAQDLKENLLNGKDVVIFGTEPFESLETSFRIGLAGRCSGNLATVIHDHPLLKDLPHKGFCSWQFSSLMEGGNAVFFDDGVPFNPIVEVVSTHKYVIRQSSLFELKFHSGRLIVCSMNFESGDPGANWLKERIISYALGADFNPKSEFTDDEFDGLLYSKAKRAQANSNFAFNENDKSNQKVKDDTK